MHGFECAEALMVSHRGVASVAVEVRFPPSFPHAPPFFRVIRPRFRPFAQVRTPLLSGFNLTRLQGGGGNVTLGEVACLA